MQRGKSKAETKPEWEDFKRRFERERKPTINLGWRNLSTKETKAILTGLMPLFQGGKFWTVIGILIIGIYIYVKMG